MCRHEGKIFLMSDRTYTKLKTETPVFSGRVLVAEDIEGNQQLIELLLSMLGVEVVVANDGKQAIEKALSQSFDLILMDMEMPYMNGYEATRRLRQQGYKTPIVAVTAHAMKGDDQKCIDAGCDGYLPKPINRRELPRLLAAYLPTVQDTTTEARESVPEQTCEPQSLDSAQTSCSTPHEADGSDTIDWDRLIDEWGSKEIVSDALSTYFKNIVENYDRLAQAVQDRDCKAIALRAHALKGVGRNLYFEPLFNVADQMERAGRANDSEASALYFREVKKQTKKVIATLSQCDWIETHQKV
jgi:CheY-like chemotaxis protein/HPt (histidine-containing phosphotransfer) domain-containing protein